MGAPAMRTEREKIETALKNLIRECDKLDRYQAAVEAGKPVPLELEREIAKWIKNYLRVRSKRRNPSSKISSSR
jgi:hypothetical protein